MRNTIIFSLIFIPLITCAFLVYCRWFKRQVIKESPSMPPTRSEILKRRKAELESIINDLCDEKELRDVNDRLANIEKELRQLNTANAP